MQASISRPLDVVQPARDWQARRIGQIAFGATVLFLAQLYLAPTQWFPVTEPLRLALVLSGVSLAALAVHRLVTNKPLWLGWRGALLAAAAGVLLFAPSTFWLRNETISTYAEDVSVQGRMQAWQVAARIVRERPLLGVGESAFLTAWKQYAPIDDPVEHPYVAHNLELEVLGQLGVIGLFGMLGFIACSLWSAWRARNGGMAHESRAVLAALIGYLVCQQFSGYSLSWFLYALCAFASCIDRYGGRKAVEVEPTGSYGSPLRAA